MLLQKKRSYAEVYNDKWGTVVNVFRVLRDPDLAKKLENQLRLTPFSRDEFLATGQVQIESIDDPVEKARRTILRSFAGFGSAATNAKYATGFRADSRRSGTTPAHDWANYPNHIETFIERLRGVVIENKEYKSVLIQHDSNDTLHYVDPPYVHSTRNFRSGNAAYEYEMNDSDHGSMVELLNSLSGMVVLSGYECGLYDDILAGWTKIKRSAFADGASKRIECLWLNKQAASRNPVQELF